MKIPDSIKLFGVNYNIKQYGTEKGVSQSNEGSLGEVWNLREEIRLADTAMDFNIRPAQKRKTLLHELFHAAMFEFGITNLVEESLEECLCDFFAKTMDYIIKENPDEIRRLYAKK